MAIQEVIQSGNVSAVRMAALHGLRHVYGVSDKVLMMTLSSLLLARTKPTWTEVGAHMIAIDTLVHNFLHRTTPATARRRSPLWPCPAAVRSLN
jgi:hypothetical protein